MSIRLISAVFDGMLPSLEKLVLLALSDHADDAGENCFPSVSRIARKCSMSRRGVQKILRRLEAKSMLRPVGQRPNGTIQYTVTPRGGEYDSRGERTVFAGEGRTGFAEGANQSAQGGERYSPESSLTINQPPEEKIVRAPTERKPNRSTPLLNGFELDADMIMFAVSQGLNAQEEFEAFCDYHRSKGNLYRDWKAAWRTWVRNTKKFDRRSKGVNRAQERDRANLKAAGFVE